MKYSAQSPDYTATYQGSCVNFQNPYPPPPPPNLPSFPTDSSYMVTPTTASYNSIPSMCYPPSEDYNPEDEPEQWKNESEWEQPPSEMETPESPPLFEKEGYSDPIEYHDSQRMGSGVDIDHRVLPMISPKNETG